MDFTFQEIIGAVAFLIGLVGSVLYVVTILQHKTKPHLYTWLVFGILTSIAFLAQVHEHAGPGVWTTGMTAASCIFTALLAFKYGTKDIHPTDKISLAVSLLAIIPWLMMDDPLWSVVMVSLIDCVAMVPTLRKSWHKPYEENMTTYAIANVKTVLSLIALTTLNLTTVLYPVAITLVNFALIFLCLWRRRVMAENSQT